MKINGDQIKYLSKVKNSFYDDLKLEFLYHSNHLEGSTFSKKELDELLIERKVSGSHSLDDIIETNNSLEVFDQVIEDCEDELNKFMLFDWQRLLKKGTVDEEIHNTGKWKKYENQIRGVEIRIAEPIEVENMMYNLIADWNETANPTIIDIANFHYRFEMIHPFQDGNGRIGRFIILKQCLESNIDLIAIDNEYSTEYKKALYEAQVTKDSTHLVEVFKKCQERTHHKLCKYLPLLETIQEESNIHKKH